MSVPRWRMVEVIDQAGSAPKERAIVPHQFFAGALDGVLPNEAVVIRGSHGFALDVMQGNKREPAIAEPLPWHEFLSALTTSLTPS